MSETKTYTTDAWFYGSVRYDTRFQVEATSKEEATRRVKELLDASGGNDTDVLIWNETHLDGDGDFEFTVEEEIQPPLTV